MRIALLLTIIAAATASAPAFARLQPDIVCVDPDIEFPVACDEEDE
jgi:hypothetical protein